MPTKLLIKFSQSLRKPLHLTAVPPVRRVHSQKNTSPNPLKKGLKILFGENHTDSATRKILRRLAPDITVFKDEVPKTMGMEEVLKILEKSDPTYESIKGLYIKNNLDIQNPKDHELFKSLWFKIHGVTENSMGALDKIETKIAKKEALSTKASFHARNGIAHFPPFQREILKRISYQEASATFCFFYIFSDPFVKVQGINPSLWKQQGILPLGCTEIDLRKVSEEEAVHTIKTQVNQKAEEFSEYQRTTLK